MLCVGRTFGMNEIASFFDTLADRWDELCYHDPEKIAYILNRTTLAKGFRILDIGCGTGILESYLLPFSPSQIVGVDLSPRMIRKAQAKYATPLVKFRCTDVLQIQGEWFDYIIAYSVFPHFKDPEKIISHLATLLKPGGELVICHSESRDEINKHHHRHAEKLSFGLPTSSEMTLFMQPFFKIRTVEETDRLYIVSGIRAF